MTEKDFTIADSPIGRSDYVPGFTSEYAQRTSTVEQLFALIVHGDLYTSGTTVPSDFSKFFFLKTDTDAWYYWNGTAYSVFSTGGGGGLSLDQIVSGMEARTGDARLAYSALKGTPTIPTVPDRAGAFTSADETKLDGIESGAQVNPRHVSLPFRTQDGNSVLAGEVKFYKSDNSQWQSGSSNQIAAIEIHPSQCDLTQNPQVDTATYTGWHSLPDDLVASGGSSIWTFQRIGTSSPYAPIDGHVFRILAQTIIKNDDGNYLLQNVSSLEDYTTQGTGYSWQVVAAFAPPSGANEIIGGIPWAKLSGVPERVGTFSADDESNLDVLVAETDKALGSYTRVASASSLAAGQFYYSAGQIQLVSATGNDVHPYWHAGEVFTLGTARFTLTTGSTIGVNRVSGGIAIESGQLPAVNASGTLTHKGVLARTGDISRVGRTGEYTDLLNAPDVVTREELVGRETDRYFSYTNASNEYWVGTIKFYNQTTGAPDNNNLIRQPDIANGTITVAVGQPRTDRDPNNNFALGTEYQASDFVSGQVYRLADWNAYESGGTLTLTSGGTVIGTGNARRVWFRATLALTGTDLVDVSDNGDYWLFAEEEPTQLPIEIPATDVLGLVDYIISRVTKAPDPIDGDTMLMLSNLTGLSINHLERHFADRYASFGNFNIVTSSQYDAKGEIDSSQLTNANKQIRLGLPDSIVTDFDAEVSANMLVELYKDASNYLLGRVTERTNDSLRSSINGRYVRLSTLDIVGTVGAGDTVEFRLYKSGDGLVPIPGADDAGKELEATGANAYGWVTKNPPKAPAAQATTKFYRMEVPSTSLGTAPLWSEEPAPYAPTITDEITVPQTEAWTEIGSGYVDDDILLLCTEGAYSSESSNVAMVGVARKFSNMPTSGRWLGIRANSAGARIEVRRNGNTVQAREQGGTANCKAWIVKLS